MTFGTDEIVGSLLQLLEMMWLEEKAFVPMDLQRHLGGAGHKTSERAGSLGHSAPRVK